MINYMKLFSMTCSNVVVAGNRYCKYLYTNIGLFATTLHYSGANFKYISCSIAKIEITT